MSEELARKITNVFADITSTCVSDLRMCLCGSNTHCFTTQKNSWK